MGAGLHKKTSDGRFDWRVPGLVTALVLVVAVCGIATVIALRTGQAQAGGPGGNGSRSSTTTTVPPTPLTITSVSPTPGSADASFDTSVTVNFSEPLATDSPFPKLSPAPPGKWVRTAPTSVRFEPEGYFVPFTTTFARWCTFLKPSAWVCLIDIDDLLGHEPRSEATRDTIERFYGEAFEKRRYDFRVGRRLASALESHGFHVSTTELTDRELNFNGPASPEVLEAWRARLARMGGLRSFLGDGLADFTGNFVRTLQSPQHRALCRVVCCVGRRG